MSAANEEFTCGNPFPPHSNSASFGSCATRPIYGTFQSASKCGKLFFRAKLSSFCDPQFIKGLCCRTSSRRVSP